MSEIKYEIIKRIGVLSKSGPAPSRAEGSGWAKELNLISWNDRDPKYDLRDWSADGGKMGKGVTLSKEELLALKELLNKLEL
ncbi:MAG: PC4/YdbC family ssDNA-binding protein [Chloroflexota bacterium]|nr:PC4/YdbC family ssDNA-binding protein [Chloroflexota bacterium]